MADVTVDSEGIYLCDLLPGYPDPRLSPPRGGFTGADHHNVVAAAYGLGTKIQVRNHASAAGVEGYSTFVYGKLEHQDTTNILAPRHFLAHHTDCVPYDFTNDAGTDLGAGLSPLVVGLSAMTVDFFGWFWCGGVCPEEWVSALGGVYYGATAGAIGACMGADLTAPGLVPGEIGYQTRAGDTKPCVLMLSIAAA
ncbi:MAG TPA: hypothetical protein VMY35_12185 [Phycisphaerae bacterium]|nr:hypothetical protein [Phycisphaerae bacterium]